MLKYTKTLVIIVLLIFSFSWNVQAESITQINDLIENAKTFDGQEITVKGEAIGERMDRGNYSWVNINDRINAIGIWIKKSDAEKINYYGDYKHKGDTIEIIGIFNRACPEHGGEADIHNNSINIVQNGNVVNEQISPTKVLAAVILSFIVVFILLLFIKIIK